jgi:hypothetical protein
VGIYCSCISASERFIVVSARTLCAKLVGHLGILVNPVDKFKIKSLKIGNNLRKFINVLSARLR